MESRPAAICCRCNARAGLLENSAVFALNAYSKSKKHPLKSRVKIVEIYRSTVVVASSHGAWLIGS